ncbi:protein kinase [Streptomyces sp. NPDC048111]|uniref:serine/threonine-protein kinase n=1 Tax=Streptomyces sp. NPDC048111 TaxID=3365500 RepID=UPI0037128D10
MPTAEQHPEEPQYRPEPRLVAGRYRLGGRLGRGGMGTVWRAHDELLGRHVAVKELHPEGGAPASAALREARAVAQIKHPHVIVVHDVVEEAVPARSGGGRRSYIVMELVDGFSLADRLASTGPVGVREAARIGVALLGALGTAHARGVLHRDLKPANVLIERDGGRVVLTDFGIAQVPGTSTISEEGAFVGSPEYTAPERMRGAGAGPASDLWSLGALLCAALSGESPFHRDSLGGVLHAVVLDEIRPPEAAGPLLPVVHGLLERDPAHRLGAHEADLLLRRIAAPPAPPPSRPVPPGDAAPGREAPRPPGGPAPDAATAPPAGPPWSAGSSSSSHSHSSSPEDRYPAARSLSADDLPWAEAPCGEGAPGGGVPWSEQPPRLGELGQDGDRRFRGPERRVDEAVADERSLGANGLARGGEAPSSGARASADGPVWATEPPRADDSPVSGLPLRADGLFYAELPPHEGRIGPEVPPSLGELGRSVGRPRAESPPNTGGSGGPARADGSPGAEGSRGPARADEAPGTGGSGVPAHADASPDTGGPGVPARADGSPGAEGPLPAPRDAASGDALPDTPVASPRPAVGSRPLGVRGVLVGAVLVVVLAGAGAAVAVLALGHGGSRHDAGPPPSPAPPAATWQQPPPPPPRQPPPLPKGFHPVLDPDGFRIVVPVGYVRSTDAQRVFYSSSDGAVRIGIRMQNAVSAGPLGVMRLSAAKGPTSNPGYRDGKVTATTHHGRDAALWEFTWNGFSKAEGPRHTFDECWDNFGRMYDVWVSAPLARTDDAKRIFDTALDSFFPGPDEGPGRQ